MVAEVLVPTPLSLPNGDILTVNGEPLWILWPVEDNGDIDQPVRPLKLTMLPISMSAPVVAAMPEVVVAEEIRIALQAPLVDRITIEAPLA